MWNIVGVCFITNRAYALDITMTQGVDLSLWLGYLTADGTMLSTDKTNLTACRLCGRDSFLGMTESTNNLGIRILTQAAGELVFAVYGTSCIRKDLAYILMTTGDIIIYVIIYAIICIIIYVIVCIIIYVIVCVIGVIISLAVGDVSVAVRIILICNIRIGYKSAYLTASVYYTVLGKAVGSIKALNTVATSSLMPMVGIVM
jgi:hypothetical protein